MESFIFLFCAFRVPPWKRSLSTSTRNARQNTKSAQRGEVSLHRRDRWFNNSRTSQGFVILRTLNSRFNFG
jgi:hypothetical protein